MLLAAWLATVHLYALAQFIRTMIFVYRHGTRTVAFSVEVVAENRRNPLRTATSKFISYE